MTITYRSIPTISINRRKKIFVSVFCAPQKLIYSNNCLPMPLNDNYSWERITVIMLYNYKFVQQGNVQLDQRCSILSIK